MKRLFVGLALASSIACAAHTYHQAVAVEYAFSVAVGIADDAVFDACTVHALPADRCNTDIKQTVSDLDLLVKAAAISLQQLPPGTAMPKTVPDLLAGLNKLQAILQTVGDASNPVVARAASAVLDAIAKTTNLLYIFTGGLQ